MRNTLMAPVEILLGVNGDVPSRCCATKDDTRTTNAALTGSKQPAWRARHEALRRAGVVVMGLANVASEVAAGRSKLHTV